MHSPICTFVADCQKRIIAIAVIHPKPGLWVYLELAFWFVFMLDRHKIYTQCDYRTKLVNAENDCVWSGRKLGYILLSICSRGPTNFSCRMRICCECKGETVKQIRRCLMSPSSKVLGRDNFPYFSIVCFYGELKKLSSLSNTLHICFSEMSND